MLDIEKQKIEEMVNGMDAETLEFLTSVIPDEYIFPEPARRYSDIKDENLAARGSFKYVYR